MWILFSSGENNILRMRAANVVYWQRELIITLCKIKDSSFLPVIQIILKHGLSKHKHPYVTDLQKLWCSQLFWETSPRQTKTHKDGSSPWKRMTFVAQTDVGYERIFNLRCSSSLFYRQHNHHRKTKRTSERILCTIATAEKSEFTREVAYSRHLVGCGAARKTG